MFRELVAQHRFFRLRLDGERGGTRRSADARRRSGCLEKEGTRNTRCVEKGRTRTYLELEQPGEQVPAELAQRLLLNLQTREHVLRGGVRGCREFFALARRSHADAACENGVVPE